MKTIQMMAGGTGMGGAKEMAEMLRRMGRNGDTMLAHITPEEAELLADLGGAGTENPETGLPEFYPFDDFEPVDINDLVTEARFDRLRNPQPVSSYQETEPDRNIFRQDYSQPRQTTTFDTGASSYRGVDVPRDIFAPRARTGDTISADYLRDTNLRGGGDFEQIPALRQPTSSLGTYRGVTVPTDIFANFEPLQDQTAALQAPEEPGFAARAETRLKELEDVLNQYPRLTRAGTAGAGILAQALLFNRANRAMTRDIEETRRAAEPFRAAQAEAMGRATGAGLTPEQEQDLEIAQARARQGLGERGLQTGSAASGILAAQQRRARSLARQEGFQEALRLANIADQYDQRALQIELQRDQQLGQLFASIVGREVQQAQRETAPAAPAAPTAM